MSKPETQPYDTNDAEKPQNVVEDAETQRERKEAGSSGRGIEPEEQIENDDALKEDELNLSKTSVVEDDESGVNQSGVDTDGIKDGPQNEEDGETREGDDEGDEEEEEEEEPEMTDEEKQEMFNAVSEGDIDLLEDLWDKPNSNINTIWYNENLLVCAIRSGQAEMAEFLLDNGVDQNYTWSLYDVNEKEGRLTDWYTVTARQMAYDREMFIIVEMIDILNDQLLPGVKPTPRTPRYRRPKPPTPPISEDGEDEDALLAAESEDGVDENAEQSKTGDQPVDKELQSVMKNDQKEDPKEECQDFDSGLFSTNSVSKVKAQQPSEKDNNEKDRYSDVSNLSQRKESDGYNFDEGYETMSPKSSPRCSPMSKYDWSKFRYPVTSRPTKSSLMLKNYKSQTRLSKEAKQDQRPRKSVNAVGSYSRESKHWHNVPIGGNTRAEMQRTPKQAWAANENEPLKQPKKLQVSPIQSYYSNLNFRASPSGFAQVSYILSGNPLLSPKSNMSLPVLTTLQKRSKANLMMGRAPFQSINSNTHRSVFVENRSSDFYTKNNFKDRDFDIDRELLFGRRRYKKS